MTRMVNLVLLTVMLIGAIVTFNMKLNAEKAADNVARLENEIGKQKEALQLLRAELSMLLQPGRLQAVVERHADYFKLEDFSPEQYATIDDVPMKPIGTVDENSVADMIDGDSRAIQ